MARKIYLLSVLLLSAILFIPHAVNAQWTYMGGDFLGGNIYFFTSSGNDLYGAVSESYPYSYNGVLHSTNNGITWDKIGGWGISVYSVATSGDYLYAACGNYVYITTNKGTVWNSSFVIPSRLYSIAARNNFVYAGGEYSGIYTSTDYGMTWTKTSTGQETPWCFAFDGNDIYAGTADYAGVYRSTDNGMSWIPTNFNKNAYYLTVSGNKIYAPDGMGLYSSTDKGVTWIPDEFMSGKQPQTVASAGNFIFTGTQEGFYVSPDNGKTWIAKNDEVPPEQFFISLYIHNNFLFAATLYKSIWRLRLTDLECTLSNKTQVCHNGITLCIGPEAVSHHLGHGDYLGPCGTDNSVKADLTPDEFKLHNNYPNPFNPVTRIEFDIPSDCRVTLTVFDISGRNIATLVNENKKAGYYSVDFNASNLSSGVYFYSITAGKYHSTKRMLLIK